MSAAGAVLRVHSLRRTTWVQQAYVKASNTGAGDDFGKTRRALGGRQHPRGRRQGEDSNATGINGNQSDNSSRTAARYTCLPARERPGANRPTSRRRTPSTRMTSAANVALVEGRQHPRGRRLQGGQQRDRRSTAARPITPKRIHGAAYVFTRSGTTLEPAGLYQGVQHRTRATSSARASRSRAMATPSRSALRARTATRPGSTATSPTTPSADSRRGIRVYPLGNGVEPAGLYQGVQHRYRRSVRWQAVALSTNGNTLASARLVRGQQRDLINGNQADNSATGQRRRVRFTRVGTSGATGLHQGV